MIYSQTRLVSALIALSLFHFINSVYSSLFLGFLFCHYLLSAIYSKHQIINLASQQRTLFPLFVLLSLTAATLYIGWPKVPYLIVLHIALSEVYMLGPQYLKKWSDPTIKKINIFRFLTALAIALILTRGETSFNWIQTQWVIAIGIASLLCSLWILYRQKAPIDFISYELLGATFATSSLLTNWQIAVPDLVFYHILTWLWLPMTLYIRQSKKKELRRFFLWNILLTSVFLMIGTSFFGEQLQWIDLKSHIPLFATLHILSSIALSRLNPMVIRKQFYSSHSLELRT